jgi:class 3 adenylate cyclase
VVRVRARGLWGGVNAWTRRQRGASDEQAGETGGISDSLDDLGDRLGVPIPSMPPMPQLPGPSLDGAIPPMSRRDRQRERHRDRERVRDWALEWAQAAHRGHWGANSANNTNSAGNSNNAGNANSAGGSGPTGSMHGTGPATPTATTAGDPAPTGASPEPATGATGATETNHRPPGGGTVTVVVTDICRSTEMASRLGDQRWLGVLQTHNALVRDQIRRHHGTEVKAQGDGFLVTFTSARQAVLGAIGIQRAMAGYRRAHPEHQVELRVGVHTGEVVEDHGDVIGQNVIVAVRIADAATPGEILVSSLTKDLTDAGGDLGYDDGREVELKGVSRAWRVHAVEWV